MAQTYQARFLQAGGTIDHTPSAAVSAGDVVRQNDMVGISRSDISASALGSLTVAGNAVVVKVNGAINAGASLFWDTNGDPEGGTSGTGALTTTSSGNTYMGYAIAAAASGDETVEVHMVPAIAVTVVTDLNNVIADPGDSGAIPVTASGSVAIVSGGVETRTLAVPPASSAGRMLNVYMKTDGGTVTLTVASPVNQTGNNTLVFAEVDDSIQLIAIESGSNLEWRVLAVDGVVLSTV